MHVGRLNPLKERIQCTLKHSDAANISENECIKYSLIGRNSTTSRVSLWNSFGEGRGRTPIFEVHIGDAFRRGRVATTVERWDHLHVHVKQRCQSSRFLSRQGSTAFGGQNIEDPVEIKVSIVLKPGPIVAAHSLADSRRVLCRA